MAWRAVLVIACCAFAACNKKPSPAPGERITGSERLGWDQQAADATELATFHYAVYVDGMRSELPDAACMPAPSGFTCSARLPVLTGGSHTIEVASYISDLGVVESAKSAALRVTVGGAAVFSGPAKAGPHVRTDVEGRADVAGSDVGAGFSRPTLITEGLVEPTDLAFAPDGRIFIAERSGAVRVIRDSHLEAATPDIVDEVDTRGGGGLLGMVLAPDFARTGHVFVVHTATGADGTLVFRLARFREINGTFGDRAVLLDGIPAAPVQPRASLRFGSDGTLYVAFDDGGAGGDRSSYSGTLLRLNADGSMPAGQSSPIIGQGLRSPRGLAWSPETGRLWLADVRSDGSEQLIAGSRRYALPESTGTSAVAFLGDALLVAGADAMLRVRFNADGEAVQGVERLVEGEGLTPVRVVAVSPVGEIYFCTETGCWVAR